MFKKKMGSGVRTVLGVGRANSSRNGRSKVSGRTAGQKPEKLDTEAMGKLLRKLKEAAKLAVECGEITNEIQEKLDFQ